MTAPGLVTLPPGLTAAIEAVNLRMGVTSAAAPAALSAAIEAGNLRMNVNLTATLAAGLAAINTPRIRGTEGSPTP